jgi:peptidoglycan/LPS O-acetylase OafA/YrhL
LAAHELTFPADPGKQNRAASGIPIFPVLDGLRWLALMSVVAYHVWGAADYSAAFRGTPLPRLIGYAAPGLELMFVLSGVVMFLPAAARGGEIGSLRAYAIRRTLGSCPPTGSAWWWC